MTGIFGVISYDKQNVLDATYRGLRTLQTRGQESTGISVADGNSIRTYKEKGFVKDVFKENILGILNNPTDRYSIGHVRKFRIINENNVEPVELEDDNLKISIVMDGRLFEQDKFKEYDVDSKESTELFGKIFLKHLKETGKANKAAEKTMKDLDKGYFSTAILVNNGKETREIGIRDKRGVKPFCIGRLGKTYFLSSESVAFDSLNAELLRDIKPGEFIEFNSKYSEPNSEQLLKPEPKLCAFEFNYYANRASKIEGRFVDDFRKEMGRKIFEMYKHLINKKGKVGPLPDSGKGVSLGFAEASGLTYDEFIIKNPYAPRTFIIPEDELRAFETSIKYNVVKNAVEGQILYVGDDSIVRGTETEEVTIILIKRGEAAEVNYIIGSPPLIATCPEYFHEGPKSFIANKYKGKNIQEIGRCVAKEISANSVFYPTLDMEVETLKIPKENLCLACFTGKYPFEITS